MYFCVELKNKLTGLLVGKSPTKIWTFSDFCKGKLGNLYSNHSYTAQNKQGIIPMTAYAYPKLYP